MDDEDAFTKFINALLKVIQIERQLEAAEAAAPGAYAAIVLAQLDVQYQAKEALLAFIFQELDEYGLVCPENVER